MSYIARVRLPFASSWLWETKREEECFHTFQRWHSAGEFSCRKNIGFLRGLLDLSHDQSRPVVWSTRTTLVGVDPTQGRCLGSFCIHVLAKDCFPNVHATAPPDFLLSCLLVSVRLKHSATHVDKGVLSQAFFMWSRSSHIPEFFFTSKVFTNDLMPIHFHLQTPVRLDTRKTFAPFLERLGLYDSFTMMKVLSQIQVCPPA